MSSRDDIKRVNLQRSSLLFWRTVREREERDRTKAMTNCIVLAAALLTLIVSAKGSGDVSELQIGIKFKPKSCEIQAQNDDKIRVHYEGMLTDGTVFDSSYEVDEPIKFRLGRGRVIKGWDLGLLGMCLGERRRLKIPPKLAYGDRGKPPRIPRGATLIFDTQLVSVNGIYFDPDED